MSGVGVFGSGTAIVRLVFIESSLKNQSEPVTKTEYINDCNPIIYESFADVRAVVVERAVVIDVVIIVTAAFENERGPSSVVGDAVVTVVRQSVANSLSTGRPTADGTSRHSPNFAAPRHAAVDAVVAGPVAAGVVML